MKREHVFLRTRMSTTCACLIDQLRPRYLRGSKNGQRPGHSCENACKTGSTVPNRTIQRQKLQTAKHNHDQGCTGPVTMRTVLVICWKFAMQRLCVALGPAVFAKGVQGQGQGQGPKPSWGIGKSDTGNSCRCQVLHRKDYMRKLAVDCCCLCTLCIRCL